MTILLAGMNEFLWGVGGTLATAAVLAGFGWAWRMNASMTRIETSLDHMQKTFEDKFKSVSEHWDDRFRSLQREVEAVKTEIADLRRGVQ
jgi:septal ring factor EnvC (AmiA/AmiB activator)